MSEIALSVEHLSKRYRIGLEEKRADTFVGSAINLIRQPERNFRRLVSLSQFGSNGEDDASIMWALRDVSFEMRTGEVLGLIGPNGAGKSTLLKILTRITEPTGGSATIKGRVSSLLEVGTGFHQELTGRENVYLNGSVLGMGKSDIDRRFDEIVEFSGVERFIDTPVKRYSSGMQVRLAFSVAAHLEPDVLLVDEVLAVGDAAFQKKCLGQMDRVAEEGRTIVFVSHNMSAVRNLCKRGLLLEGGTVVEDGPMDEVMNKYLEVDTETLPEEVWDDPSTAPGDERVNLRAVRVTSGGKIIPEIGYSKSFDIEVDYQNLIPDTEIGVSIHIRNAMGDLVFTSSNSPDANQGNDSWYGKPLPVGIYRTTCTVPSRLLNEGGYSVSVYLGGGFIKDKIVREIDVISFHIKDMERDTREFQGEWLGVVRPMLAWNTVVVKNG
jgi:lipopolysaccharide transport system ATP-binding protein